MKAGSKGIKVGGLLIVILVVGFLGMTFYRNSGRERKDLVAQEGQTNLLARPVFAQSMSGDVTFLDEEAGISMYANVGSLDLSKARTAYRTIEDDTPDYIVGSLPLPNLTSSDDVHCFVHKDGWIVVYYLKNDPLSKIIDWNYWIGGQLTKNKLQAGLEVMSDALEMPVADANYYHFNYSGANKCMIAIKTQVGPGEGHFNIKIPLECSVYERSWSHYAGYTLGYYIYQSQFKVDGNATNTISGINHPITIIGQLNESQLSSDVLHSISVNTNIDFGSYLYGVAIGLVYAEP
jgi:hypothetical protein